MTTKDGITDGVTPKEGETTRNRATKKQSGMIEFGVTKYDRLCGLCF